MDLAIQQGNSCRTEGLYSFPKILYKIPNLNTMKIEMNSLCSPNYEHSNDFLVIKNN